MFRREGGLVLADSLDAQGRIDSAGKKRHPSGSAVRRLRRQISNLAALLYPLIGRIVLAWVGAVNRRAKIDRRGPAFEFIRDGKPFIFTFWHEDCLALLFEMSRGLRQSPHLFMVSPGRTGNLGAYLLSLFDVETIAGSGSAKGINAVNRLGRRYRRKPSSIYILADGSRGPHQEMRWGALYLARDTGLPIIAGRAWSDSLFRLKRTWMGLALPLPWGRTVVLTSEPLYVPPDIEKEELEVHRADLQRRLDELAQASLDYFEKGKSAADPFGAPWAEFPTAPQSDPSRTGSDLQFKSSEPASIPAASAPIPEDSAR